MPEICTAVSVCAGGGHATATIAGRVIELHEQEHGLLVALTEDEEQLFLRLCARKLRQHGVTLPQFLRRVLHGDEATNVKIYNFFGPGAAITKTNIGVNYINICPGANGERLIADFTGCTEFRLMLHANLVGTGQWGARVVRDGDNVALFEAANLGAGGERELDTDWQPLPAAFLGQGLVALRAQAKSTTASDDPTFRALRVGLR